MASEAELNKLRSRIAAVLSSPACFAIRFKLDNVGIQTFMYKYIAQAILDKQVNLDIGSGHSYDHVSNTMTLDSENPGPFPIVHEATHAVINATHVAKTITAGTHEASAYLAEILYALNSGSDNDDLDVPHLAPLVRQLAVKVMAFNKSHSDGLFICPPSDILPIKTIIGNALRKNVDRQDYMYGIGDGPHEGLIRHLWLENKRNTP